MSIKSASNLKNFAVKRHARKYFEGLIYLDNKMSMKPLLNVVESKRFVKALEQSFTKISIQINLHTHSICTNRRKHDKTSNVACVCKTQPDP